MYVGKSTDDRGIGTQEKIRRDKSGPWGQRDGTGMGCSRPWKFSQKRWHLSWVLKNEQLEIGRKGVLGGEEQGRAPGAGREECGRESTVQAAGLHRGLRPDTEWPSMLSM